MKTVVTKAEYAALKQRKPSAISNWIAAGKISRAALIGEGVRARIWVEQADADLVRNLDPAQQSAQVVPVAASSSLPIESGPGPPAALTSPRATAANDDEDIRRRRKADADRAEHEAEAARRKLAVDEGRWVDAADAEKEFGRELAKLISETEAFLFTIVARDIGDRHGVDWKAESMRLRQLYRQHRTQVADAAQNARAVRQSELLAAE